MSAKDYLQRYLSSAPTGETSDYIQPKKKKKGKKKSNPVKPSGLVVVDHDAEASVKPPEPMEEEEEEDEVPIFEVSKEYKADLEKQEEIKRLKEELGENLGWVQIDDGRSSGRATDGDLSPPRRSLGDRDEDLSPPRRPVSSSDRDLSPPRRPARGAASVDADASPPRRPVGSPVSRKRSRPIDDDDASPPRRSVGVRDASPPRRPVGDDASPPRRPVGADDRSPPRRPLLPDDDASPGPRRDSLLTHHGDGDQGDASPQRKRAKLSDEDRHRTGASRAGSNDQDGPRMLSGERAGLRTGAEVVAEAREKQAREKARLQAANPKSLGKDAETVYRDRHGRKLEMLNQMMRQQTGAIADDDEANMEWGRGLVSKEQREKEDKRKKEEADAPYRGQSIDNEELNDVWKSKDRWSDPMLSLLSGDDGKKSDKKKKKKKEYKGDFPPNRYNMRPGYRWDGVDRSNGFERDFFQNQNKKKVHGEAAYRYLSADM